ncbi:MAG: hypothetical protein ACP5D2_01640 [Candidatus Nanoarchaeia archaeon]
MEIKNSKPIEQVKKGDKVKIDSKELEVDAHYVLMEHKDNKGERVLEMAIELFNPKDEDEIWQLRYFPDRLEFMEAYRLEGGLMFVQPIKEPKKIEF